MATGHRTPERDAIIARDPDLFDGQRIHVPMVFGEPGVRKLISYDAVFAEADGVRLDPGYELLKSAKVAIVGCGSVGSKVAVQLARSGVGSFVLVDGDVLSAGNLVRRDGERKWVSLPRGRKLEVVAQVRAEVRRYPGWDALCEAVRHLAAQSAEAEALCGTRRQAGGNRSADREGRKPRA